MDECICNPPNYNLSCPRHQWYFEEMRKPPKVCDNSLMDGLYEKPEKKFKVLNRKDRRAKGIR